MDRKEVILNNKNKGISPVVATVLLIGMVVVIGLIIFLWFRGFVGSACEKFDRNCELTCENVQFDTNYDTSSSNLFVSNIGDVPIYGFKVEMSRDGSFTTEDIRDFSSGWPTYGLGPGKTFSTPLDIGSSDTITIIPVILGSSNSGEESFVCEDRFGFEIPI
ncbi:MAG: archaellin/type IV pilin N-terminal domain-containing protein [Candidatus Nanoarchaeia archaeon]